MDFGPSFSAPVMTAGAVLWRGAGMAREVAVVRAATGDWCFPKGRIRPGEHMTAAAVRAVSESTGLRVRLGPWLGFTGYSWQGWPERADYFAAEADPGACGGGDLLWLAPGRAADALSRPDDVRILYELERRAASGAGCFLLIRDSACSARPILSAYGVTEDACGMAEETAADRERALRIAGDSFGAGRPAAVRADPGTVRDLFGELCRRRVAPVPVEATVPEGGLLVLHGTRERIFAVERHLA
ncbi:NUDIX domain-containing protein [Actinoplanes sp. NPDC049802]|uniref:NUDIX domain-containing protein n=1 Tax=Actinoplanes sp. NPDC049802 TaxID=3154742 RepID=UPI0033C0EEE1